MFDFSSFYQLIASEPRLQSWLDQIPAKLSDWQQKPQGDLPKWLKTLNKISHTPAPSELISRISVGSETTLSHGEQAKLENLLQHFHPWRKGPYFLHGIHIDTEWRSDWKWQRLLPHITPLEGRYVLDVGCGNGYHMWHMLGEKARTVIGVDPSELFLVQFSAVKELINPQAPLHLLPLGIEELPGKKSFDTVFSMGVLYHRKSPLDHLQQLKNQLVKNGELVLETLVITGDENSVLVPADRYASMHNVYFFPSAKALQRWLEKVGFVNVRIVDEDITSLDEQRTTAWMRHHSLKDYLDPNDISKTMEGYPAPRRAILVATNPD
ncbi:MAG: tRNA 5-methoxyuridine(34)/uridine 5-oxyacetic acid(34) synthase CmoB [Vibrionaceae bacterium]